jgi:hypothetical protein
MPSMNMQFHILPEEIAKIVQAVVDGKQIKIVLKGGLPFSAREIYRDQLGAEISKVCRDRFGFELYLLNKQPIFGAATGLKFLDANPGGVFINIGSLTDAGLKQSSLSVMDGYPEAYALAKSIAKKIREVTTSGVTAVNVEMGIMKLNKSHRYTNAAKHLEAQGVAMLPFAGGGKLMLGDVTHAL